ncbi:MAG: histidinol-phosphatase HisJ family protein [Clostridia bacterium]|nr:histidinol-phosphatase HisJ family protein [Clostridia bacterium]
MAYSADQHTHSLFSMDSQSDIDDICEKAIEMGLSELVITDHYDLSSNEMLTKLEVPFEAEKAYETLCRYRDKYAGRLKLSVGLELGQAHDCPDMAKAILEKHGYDQVIGSLHSLSGMPDFYLMAFYKITGRQCQLFLTQYFKELEQIVDLGCFDTLAHLTYPMRYFKEGGHDLSLEMHIPAIKRIFKKLIVGGKALEVNTSGYRKDLDCTLPDLDILKLYYDMGGRLITVGSDAHCVEDIGCDIQRVYSELKEIGFTHITSFTNRKPEMKEI